ncbi:DUF2617 family protein [Streptomyces sp. ST2-7A]|uniref:DUF2617 family protein n=1 Tax=Streptomyces sp. ST2-7A TaxID=2907214 RepID=UPI001F1D3DEE|nr:DUF2617 family protein [Streptomyces sp. ST2-7A]MCE7081038.1 DUF2617 family protein [Streptomyces sp. ST2-7A]
MTAISLAVPYLDTAAEQLAFSLTPERRPAHAVARVDLGGGLSAELRLLGASHQVFAGPVTETVACPTGGEPEGDVESLPRATRRRIAGWGYDFASRVERCDAAGFRRRVAALRALGAEGRADTLYAVFPGSPDAITALLARPAGGVPDPRPGWDTWHVYPQHRQIVTTRTRLEAP